MPILGSRIHVLNPVIDECDTQPPGSFIIDLTGEVCSNQAEYQRKKAVYAERIWTCICTGKTNFTFKEAKQSEAATLKYVKNRFQEYYEKPVLSIVHHSLDNLDSLVHKAWVALQEEYFLNEPVTLKINKPGSKTIAGVIVKVDKTNEGKTSTNNEPCGVPIYTIATDEKGSASKKKSAIVQKNYTYTVKLVSQNRVVNGIPAGVISRQRVPAKDVIRSFIKVYSIHYGSCHSGPWVVKQDLLTKYDIGEKIPNYHVNLNDLRKQSEQVELEYFRRLRLDLSQSLRGKKKVKTISIVSGNIGSDTEEKSKDTSIEIDGQLPVGKCENIKQVTLFDSSQSKAPNSVSPTKSLIRQSPARLPLIGHQLMRAVREGRSAGMISHLVTRCALTLSEAQMQALAPYVRDRVANRRHRLLEKEKLNSMSAEEREEYARQRRSEQKKRGQERLAERNRRQEDLELEGAGLPEGSPIVPPEGLSMDQWLRIIALSEWCQGLVGAVLSEEEAGLMSADRLVEALTRGGLGSLVPHLLHPLLQDESIRKRREIGLTLSEIPVTPYTASEIVRLVLSPVSGKTAKRCHSNSEAGEETPKQCESDAEQENVSVDGSHSLEDGDVVARLCEKMKTTELHSLAREDQLCLLEALQRRVMDLKAVDEYIEQCCKAATEAQRDKAERLKELKQLRREKQEFEKLHADEEAEKESSDMDNSLVSTVKRGRQQASEVAEEHEKQKATEKERARLERGEDDLEKAVEKTELQCRETKTVFERVMRVAPLGYDRYHRRYWRFQGGPPGIFVEPVDAGDLSALSPMKSFLTNEKNSDWLQFNSPQQLDALLSALLPQGIRESALRSKLEKTLSGEKERLENSRVDRQNSSESPVNLDESLIAGFKSELTETEVRLRRGGMGGVPDFSSWQTRLSEASDRTEWGSCLLEVADHVMDRYLLNPLVEWMSEWRREVMAARTQSRLNMLQGYLDACILWEKSMEAAKCRVCRLGVATNEDTDQPAALMRKGPLAMCSICSQTIHIACVRPPLSAVPGGDWMCPPCLRSWKQKNMVVVLERVHCEPSEEEDSTEEEEDNTDEEEEESKSTRKRRPNSRYKDMLHYEASESSTSTAKSPRPSVAARQVRTSTRGRKKRSAPAQEHSSDEGEAVSGADCTPSQESGRTRGRGRPSREAAKRPRLERRSVNNGNGSMASTLLEQLMRHRCAKPFLEPVDKNEVPDYYDVVSDPVDLNLVKQRLMAGDYGLEGMLQDLRRLFDNVHLYNQPTSEVVRTARALEKQLVNTLARLAPDVEFPASSGVRV